MKYIFNLKRTGSPTKEENPWYPCKYFNEYISDHPLPEGLKHVDLKLYNVRRDTHKGSVHALLKYDLPDEEPVLDIPTLRAAIEDTKRVFSSMEGKGKIKEPAEVLINPGGSSGVSSKNLACGRVPMFCLRSQEWFNGLMIMPTLLAIQFYGKNLERLNC